jgi:hypothetical protein
VTNNCRLIARLATEQLSGSGLDKVGVMMRASTNPNSQVQGLILDWQLGQARFPVRTSTGASMSWQQITTPLAAPLWFELSRTNNLFTGLVSTDGTNWIPVGSNTVAFPANYLAGLVDCARTTSALDVSTFDNVATTGWTSPLADTPTGLTASAGDMLANLAWNASTNAASYYLKRSATTGGPYAVVGGGLTSPMFTDTGLMDGTKYYYVVTSSNAVGESDDSAQVHVLPVSASPTTLDFGLIGGQLRLSWPPDHTGWRLQVQTNSLNVGLGANWLTAPNSTNGNEFSAPISPSNGCVFFRLVYP